MPRFTAMPSRIETERLVLRPWSDADAASLRALHAERDDPPPTDEDTAAIVRRLRGESERTGFTLFVVSPRGSDAFRGYSGLLGYCGLIVGRSTVEEPEIAYELFRRARGRGYATEAGRAVVAAAAGTGRTRLWSTVRSWNAPSFRVLDKLGFARARVDPDEHGAGDLVWLTRTLP